MRSGCQTKNIYSLRQLYSSLIICLFCALVVPLGFAFETNTQAPILEKIEILYENSMEDKAANEQRAQIMARIRGKMVSEKDITADLSQLTGNSNDVAVNPLAENLTVSESYVQATWFVTLDRRTWKKNNTIKMLVSTRDVLGDNSQEKVAQQVICVPSASRQTSLIRATDGEVMVEIGLKASTIPDQSLLPLRIVSEPAGTETAIADQYLPSRTYIPEGSKAYRIMAEDASGAPIEAHRIKDTFTLGLEYTNQIRSEAARDLKLFVLSGDRWFPLPSRWDASRRMVQTETARQFGAYRLLARASVASQDILIYPNPVQFGQFGGTSKTLKFLNVPLGSVIEIYTLTGEKIREIDVKTDVTSWDGKRENGDIVTSGLYLYRIRMVSDDAFGKIAVLR